MVEDTDFLPKNLLPSMVKAVYDHLDGKCTHGFTVGINDDVSNRSIELFRTYQYTSSWYKKL